VNLLESRPVLYPFLLREKAREEAITASPIAPVDFKMMRFDFITAPK